MRAIEFQRAIRIVIVSVVFLLFGAMFMPFFKPLLLAGLFAFAFERILKKIRFRKPTRGVPIAFMLFGFFILISAPIGLIGYRLVSIATTVSKTGVTNAPFYKSAESLVLTGERYVNRLLDRFNIKQEDVPGPAEFLSNAGTWLAGALGAVAAGVPEFVMSLFIFTIALYFFLTEANWVRSTFSSLKILKESETNAIIKILQKSSYTTLVVSALVGATQATIVSVGGLIFGYNEFLLVFVFTFFFSFIPVIGAAPVALLLAALSAVQNEWGAVIGLVVVATIAGSIDNILKPILVTSTGGEESLNPLVALLAIIGAIIVYGPLGLLLGPILAELALRIIPILFPDED